MVTVRVLTAMIIGALVSAVGALFLGEYEFDETVPILVGPMLAFIVAEIVVSMGKHRSKMMAGIVAVWSATAVLLAGGLDANGTEPIKSGAYLSAALAAAAGALRSNDWFKARRQARRGATPAQASTSGGDADDGDPGARGEARASFAPSDWLADAEVDHHEAPTASESAPRRRRGPAAFAPGPDPVPERAEPVDDQFDDQFDDGSHAGPVALRPRRRTAPTYVAAPESVAPTPVAPAAVAPTPVAPARVSRLRAREPLAPPMRRRQLVASAEADVRRDDVPSIAPDPAPTLSGPTPLDPQRSPASTALTSRAQARADAKAAKAAEKARRAAIKAENARRSAAGLPPFDPSDPEGTGEGWPEDPAGWGSDLADLAGDEAWDAEDAWS